MDEPEDGPQFFGFFMPPEMREQMRAHAELHKMSIQQAMHELYELFDGLSADQLGTLGNFINAIANDESTAGFYQGVISQKIAAKRDQCPVCGTNHAAALQAFTEALSSEPPKPHMPDAAGAEKVNEAFAQITDPGTMPPPWDQQVALMMMDTVPGSDTYTWGTLFEKYHVTLLDGTPSTGRVACTGVIEGAGPCGMVYPNIADRTVKDKDDCSTCHVRAAHG